MEKKINTKLIVKRCFSSFVGGIIIGTIIGLFLKALSLISEASKYFYTSENQIEKLVMILLCLSFSFVCYLLIKIRPSINSSGVPLIERDIQENRRTPYVLDIPFMIINTAITFFAALPLGSEGPCVTLGGKIMQLTDDMFKDDDNSSSIAIGSGVGFSCAFLSPLSGFIYIFEESLHKFKPSIIYRAIFTLLGAFLMIYLINPHRFFNIENIELLNDTQTLLILILFVLNILVAIIFTKLLTYLNDKFTHYKNNIFVKYRHFLYFLIILIIGFHYFNYIGSGQIIIDTIINNQVITSLICLLIFRIIMTSFYGSGSVSGGLVIPIMCIGAIVGQITNTIGAYYFNLSYNQYGFLILLSMCMLFSYINKCPLTSIALFASYLYSNNISIFSFSSLWGVIFIICGTLLLNIFNKKDLYHQLIDIQIKYEDKLKL